MSTDCITDSEWEFELSASQHLPYGAAGDSGTPHLLLEICSVTYGTLLKVQSSHEEGPSD
jgi:hypothetical protein